MFPPESIGNLNRISEILINQDPAVISKEQILGALHLQKQKTKKLLLHNDERVLYALVLFQALLYLDNGGIKGARNCYSYFGHFSINSWPEHYPSLASVEKHAKNLYIGYTNAMPDQRYQLPNDSSFNDLLILQDAISGEPSAQVKLAIKFKNMKPPNEVAADFWLMKAAQTGFIPQPDEIEVLESTFGKSKRQSIQSIASLNTNNSKNDKRMSVLSLRSLMLPEIMEKLQDHDLEESMSKRLSLKLDFLQDAPAVEQQDAVSVDVVAEQELAKVQDKPSNSSLNTMVSQPEPAPKMAPEPITGPITGPIAGPITEIKVQSEPKAQDSTVAAPEKSFGFCFCF
ncbi:hypothetical protein HK103_000770 [Boothiomyces macroporosus]|uniref:Uncharacterized protein n=1 Tax=Boothiomyces macroporosus TaxID=261099 RepID=A0AAD5UEX9_9FUNG|nr:hypothetical protein HK103_000770 [Boothiomyces macroporosus]